MGRGERFSEVFNATAWLLVGVLAGGLGLVCTAQAAAGATPEWECVPATPGQAVTSGGTGAAPSCASGAPVLAVLGYSNTAAANYATSVHGGCGNTTGTGGNAGASNCSIAVGPQANTINGGLLNVSGNTSGSFFDSILGGDGVTLTGVAKTSP